VTSVDTFQSEFSDRVILDLLCKKRVHLKGKRREKAFYTRLTGAACELTTAEKCVYSMMPPRQEWPRPGAKRRRNCGQHEQVEFLVHHIMSRWSEPNVSAPN
jgi:hypothetical protein